MIDLHVHSCYSDGTMTPEELVQYAIEKGLSAFALTDHDTVDGIPEMMAVAKGKDITVIPGVELSVDYSGTEIHILGYYVDYKDAKLNNILKKIVDVRDNRNEKMCALLNEGGYPITYDELVAEYGDHVITRAHFAKFLLKKGAIDSVDAAFRGPLSSRSPYFVNREYLKPKQAIDLICEHGGVPVLAHPLLYKLSVSQLHTLCDVLHSYGCQGIEAKYSCNIGTDEAFVTKLAKAHDLFITGGSDFHGSNKPHIDIGVGRGNLNVSESILDNLKR